LIRPCSLPLWPLNSIHRIPETHPDGFDSFTTHTLEHVEGSIFQTAGEGGSFYGFVDASNGAVEFLQATDFLTSLVHDPGATTPEGGATLPFPLYAVANFFGGKRSAEASAARPAANEKQPLQDDSARGGGIPPQAGLLNGCGALVVSSEYSAGPTIIDGALGLAQDPTTGEFYTLFGTFSGGGGRGLPEVFLGQIDVNTGAITNVVGPLDDLYVDIAFGADGTLYAVTDDFGFTPTTLFILNPADGSSSAPLVDFDTEFFKGSDGEAIAFNAEDGLLYHLSGGEFLDVVDLSIPAIINTIPLTGDTCEFCFADALVHVNGSLFLFSIEGFFGTIDASTGEILDISEQPFAYGGLAFDRGGAPVNFPILLTDGTASIVMDTDPGKSPTGALLTLGLTVDGVEQTFASHWFYRIEGDADETDIFPFVADAIQTSGTNIGAATFNNVDGQGFNAHWLVQLAQDEPGTANVIDALAISNPGPGDLTITLFHVLDPDVSGTTLNDVLTSDTDLITQTDSGTTDYVEHIGLAPSGFRAGDISEDVFFLMFDGSPTTLDNTIVNATPGDAGSVFQFGPMTIAPGRATDLTVSAFSFNIAARTGPLAVELESFEATARTKFAPVRVEWVTSSEIDLVGFNVYRAERDPAVRNGGWTLPATSLNETLIAGKGSPSRGARYNFTDTLWLRGEERAYFLIDIDLNGRETVHGPIFARILDNAQTQGEVETLPDDGQASGDVRLPNNERTRR
jgi:hypothetical protein